jgi:hypothetical protein
MTHPKLVDKDTGRFPNLTKEESETLTQLFDTYAKFIFQTAKNHIENHPEDIEYDTLEDLMKFFELYGKSKNIRLIPET